MVGWGTAGLVIGALITIAGGFCIHHGDSLDRKASEGKIIAEAKASEQALREQLQALQRQAEENKVQIIKKFTEEMSKLQENKEPELKAMFPEGYQVFGVLGKEIIPSEKPSTEEIKINWSTAKILDVTEDTISFTLPDAVLPGNNILESNTVVMSNRVGHYDKFMLIKGWAPFVEILKSDKNGIIAVLGYKRKSNSPP